MDGLRLISRTTDFITGGIKNASQGICCELRARLWKLAEAQAEALHHVNIQQRLGKGEKHF